MVEKRIHFVCRGNTFRSRLAEAYAKSLKNEGYVITSSGIDANADKKHLLMPYARAAAHYFKLVPWLSKNKTQTTETLLKRQDIIVFMSKDVYDDAVADLKFDARKAVMWDIRDINMHTAVHGKPQTKTAESRLVAQISRQIFSHVDTLFKDITSHSWSDMYDEHNKPLGYKLPINWANQRKGLWRRSVHAVVTTANRKYVVEKRASGIIFGPNMLDVSLGGGVDSGETPRQAILREMREELGVKVRPDQLTFLELKKWTSYHPHYRKYTNSHLYAFHIRLTAEDPIFVLQPNEVREVRILSARQVGHLLRRHSLKRFGRLNYGHKYYAEIVKRAKIYVK